MNEPLRSFVKNIKSLPTIPAIAQKILGLLNDNQLSVDKIEEIIEKDPAISAKILSVANSAFFGFQVSSDFLRNAIMRIGFNNVKNIALSISLMTVLDDGKRGTAFDYRRIFNHSIAVGFTARLISKKLRLDHADDYLMNGMLHDLGYLVMNRYSPEAYQEVLFTFKEGLPLLDAEKKALQFTHAEVGSWLAEEWKLPEVVQDINMFHHSPALAHRNTKQVALIHIADFLTAANILGPMEDDVRYPLDSSSLEILGLKESDLKEMEESIGGVPFSDEIFK
ncbi:MAG: HDOD domain-containing protein [Nitrospirae bacterium]|nr:HDOD domain-containing protein [Nitrospirota bacterium]